MRLLVFLMLLQTAFASPELHTEGRRFVDAGGRTVLLRGVNVSGNTKSLSYLPFRATEFDPLAAWGMNVIRLVFIWAAYEPEKGQFNDAYLDRVTKIVEAAWSRGIYTIIDMHQDSFSRYVGPGCGCGFPAWASGARRNSAPARNCGMLWGAKMALSPAMHRAFKNFYADKFGARTELLSVWHRLARHFREHPGVIGYDLLNEPWGNERKQISPYYEDAARAVRAEDPTAILFIEPHVLSAVGLKLKVRLTRPTFGNFAFAPHFYDAFAAVTQHYLLWNPLTGPFFRRLPRLAARWNAPLYIGEFGAFAHTINVQPYIERQYDLLDASLASGSQWNYTPTWGRTQLDGWNNEDYSIVGEEGQTRLNYALRPYPMRTAGMPVRLKIDHGMLWARLGPDDRGLTARSVSRFKSIKYSWLHEPRLGATELFLPLDVFFNDSGTAPQITSTDPAMSCAWNDQRTRLECSSPTPGFKTITVKRHLSTHPPGA